MLPPAGRRRAERFAELLDGAPALRADAPLAPLTGLGELLRDAGPGTTAMATMDPLARERLRMRLLAVGTVQGIGTTAGGTAGTGTADAAVDAAPRRSVAPRRAVVATAALVGVVGLATLGTSSSSAVPGDPLYAVKRSTETAQLELARSDISRGQLHLEFAKTRLDEARTVAADPEKLDATLGEMDAETKDALRLLGTAAVQRQDRAPLDALDDTLREQREGLTTLLTTLPPAARGRALDSLVLLDQVEERSKALRQALLCSAGSAEELESDSLGPKPRACSAQPAPGRRQGDPAVPGPQTSTPPPGSAVVPPAPGPRESTAPPVDRAPSDPAPSSGVAGILDGISVVAGGGTSDPPGHGRSGSDRSGSGRSGSDRSGRSDPDARTDPVPSVPVSPSLPLPGSTSPIPTTTPSASESPSPSPSTSSPAP